MPHRANPTTGVGSLDPSRFTSMVTYTLKLYLWSVDSFSFLESNAPVHNFPEVKSPDYSKRLVTSATYILELGNEKESTDPKYNFNAYVTMEVHLEGF